MDSNGRTVVDPTTDCVRIFSIQTSGDLEQKFQSTHSGPCERTLVVLLPSKAADLQVVVTAMDLIRSDRMENVSPDAELWIADPDLTAGSSE